MCASEGRYADARRGPRRRATVVSAVQRGSGRWRRATLTVKYPTTADSVPDGGDDAGGVTRVEAAAQEGGRRGQRGHGASSRGDSAPSTAVHARPLEIIGGRAGSGRCNKQTAAIRGAVTQRRQAELNADAVCCRPS